MYWQKKEDSSYQKRNTCKYFTEFVQEKQEKKGEQRIYNIYS